MFQIPTTVEIEDGTYPAVVEAIEPIETSFGSSRKWSFLVEHAGTDGAAKVDSISTITSNNLGPRSKAYGFLSGILGRPLKAEDRCCPKKTLIGVMPLRRLQLTQAACRLSRRSLPPSIRGTM